MNPAESLELIALIRRIRDLGVTIVLVEHDMKVVMQVSEHIVVLDHGEKIAEGSPAEIQRDPQGDRGLPGEGELTAGAAPAENGAPRAGRSSRRGSSWRATGRSGRSRASPSGSERARSSPSSARTARGSRRRSESSRGSSGPRGARSACAARTSPARRPPRSFAGVSSTARRAAGSSRGSRCSRTSGLATTRGGRPTTRRRRSSACSPCSRSSGSAAASSAGPCRAASSRCSPSAAR